VKRRVAVIAEPAVCLGFGMAGLRTRSAGSVAAASGLLDEMTQAEEIGVILVQEELARGWERGAEQRSAALPIVVPFPGPSGAPVPGAAAAYVAEILRQAVGYRVRLR